MRHSFPFSRSGLLPQLVVGMFIIAVLLAEAFSCSAAHAAGGGPSFGLQPVLYDPSNPVTKSYFVFDTRPGTILYSRVRVTNNGTVTGVVSLYPVDATTGQTSGTVYLSHNDPRRDVGAWLMLGTQHLTLAPGQSQVVPFQSVIPKIVRSGQHVGGIVAESLTLKSPAKKDALQIYVRNLTIVAVQVNLPGIPIEQLVATGMQPGGANNYQTLLVGLSNIGTMMLKSHGSLQVFDNQEHLLQSQSLNLDTFLPQTAINYPVYIKNQALGVGDYRATLTLTYGHGHILHYITAFAIRQQQLSQVFKASAPLQLPGLEGSPFGTLPLWQIVLGGLLLVSGLFHWGQKLYHFATIGRSKKATLYIHREREKVKR